MLSIAAQNEYFAALNDVVNTGANNSNIHRLYDEMIIEFKNQTFENENHQRQLFFNLKERFIKFSGKRIVREQLEQFEKDSFQLMPYMDLSKPNGYKETLETLENSDEENIKKIIVNCSPAQFATIIETLMDKDYLQKSGNAEGTAGSLLKVFGFRKHHPSKQSLGKLLFKEKNAICPEDVEALRKIPHRKYLKGTNS